MGANQSQEQMLGPRPHLAYCGTCKEARLTKVEYVGSESRSKMYILVAIIWMLVTFLASMKLFLIKFEWMVIPYVLLSMLFVGLVFMPICICIYFVKDVKHYCTHCEAYIGKFDPYYDGHNRQRNAMYFR